MAALIGKLLGKLINIVGLILMIPFALIGGIFEALTRRNRGERNRQNGADIRALCTELGVPSDSYNRIVLNQMDHAKDLALQIGQPGQRHYSSPWNTRLALAIAAIHEDDNQQSVDVNDLIRSLQTYISNYKEENEVLPGGVLLDHNIHLMFANAGVLRDATSLFNGVDIIPTANIEGGLTWKAIDPIKNSSHDDLFDDDVPF